MIFSRFIPPSCSYCRFGNLISGEEVACVRRGISSVSSSCSKFVYDPLKREPEKPQILNSKKITEEMSADDFKL